MLHMFFGKHFYSRDGMKSAKQAYGGCTNSLMSICSKNCIKYTQDFKLFNSTENMKLIQNEIARVNNISEKVDYNISHLNCAEIFELHNLIFCCIIFAIST